MVTILEEILLSARYETRVKKICALFIQYYIIKQKKTHGSLQIDAINAWLAVRIKKTLMKEAVE